MAFFANSSCNFFMMAMELQRLYHDDTQILKVDEDIKKYGHTPVIFCFKDETIDSAFR